MSRDVSEDDLPGIGRRYRVRGEGGASVTIVVHNSGRRDLYVFPPDSDEPLMVALSDRQAQLAGSVLTGDYSPSAEIQEIAEVIDEMTIEWSTLTPGSPGTGRSIEDLRIRSLTGINVMAILRGHSVINGPRDMEVLEAGDRLVVAGLRSSMPAFRRLVVGD